MTSAPDPATALVSAERAVAQQLLLHHTNPWELDEVMREAGFRTGVCEAWDAEGLEPELARLTRTANVDAAQKYPVLVRMIGEGRLGRSLGVGWYRYPGGGGLVIDPLVEDLLREEARFAGITRTDLSDADLAARLMAGLINEAAWFAVQNGFRPEEIDAICSRASMPALFKRADEIGAATLRDQITDMAQQIPGARRAAPLITETAGRNGSFRTG